MAGALSQEPLLYNETPFYRQPDFKGTLPELFATPSWCRNIQKTGGETPYLVYKESKPDSVFKHYGCGVTGCMKWHSTLGGAQKCFSCQPKILGPVLKRQKVAAGTANDEIRVLSLQVKELLETQARMQETLAQQQVEMEALKAKVEAQDLREPVPVPDTAEEVVVSASDSGPAKQNYLRWLDSEIRIVKSAAFRDFIQKIGSIEARSSTSYSLSDEFGLQGRSNCAIRRKYLDVAREEKKKADMKESAAAGASETALRQQVQSNLQFSCKEAKELSLSHSIISTLDVETKMSREMDGDFPDQWEFPLSHDKVPFGVVICTIEPWQRGRDVEVYGIGLARVAGLCRNNDKDRSSGPGPSKATYTEVVREDYGVGYVPRRLIGTIKSWKTVHYTNVQAAKKKHTP